MKHCESQNYRVELSRPLARGRGLKLAGFLKD